MRKKVQVVNFKEFFEYVPFYSFCCLNDLENQVYKSDVILESVFCTVNDNRDALFSLKGVKVKDAFTIFYYEFQETVA
jgi:hypothetical protein